MIGEGFSKLGVLSGLLPLSLIDMFHSTNGGFNTLWFPYLRVAHLF
jgi:hypothetical protein